MFPHSHLSPPFTYTVLYMPAFWWHEVRSQPDPEQQRNLAINYWYKPVWRKEFPCAACGLEWNHEDYPRLLDDLLSWAAAADSSAHRWGGEGRRDAWLGCADGSLGSTACSNVDEFKVCPPRGVSEEMR